MTMTKQPGQETGEALPVWDDDRIGNEVDDFTKYVYCDDRICGMIHSAATEILMLQIRDDERAAAQQRIAELEAYLEETTGTNHYLVRENAMLFDRAARRLAYIKQLEATLAELGWSDDDGMED